MKKRNKIRLGIGAIILLLIGTALILIGGWCAGWNIAEWFTSEQAILIYVLIPLVLLVAIYFWIKWIKLGD